MRLNLNGLGAAIRAGGFVLLALFSVDALAAYRGMSQGAAAAAGQTSSSISCLQALIGQSFVNYESAWDSVRACGPANTSAGGGNTWTGARSTTTCSASTTIGTSCNVDSYGKNSGGTVSPAYGALSLTVKNEGTVCQAGEVYTNGVCVKQCVVDSVAYTGIMTGFDDAASWCYSGCTVARTGQVSQQKMVLAPKQESGSVSFRPVASQGDSSTQWKRTGATCDGSTDPAGPSTNYATNGSDTVGVQPDGCGTVNGDPFCANNQPPVNGCVTTTRGQMFCSSSAPTPPVPHTETTGKDGIPPVKAAPDATATTTTPSGSSTTTNVYNVNTVSKGTGTGTTSGTTGGTTSGSTGGTTSGMTSGTTGGGGSCGGTNQPPCKLDETGTPSSKDLSTSLGYDQTEAKTSALTKAAADPKGDPNIQGQFAGVVNSLVLPSGACTSISPSFTDPLGNQRTFVFPGDAGCQRIEIIKSVLDWLIGLLTIVWILRRFAAA